MVRLVPWAFSFPVGDESSLDQTERWALWPSIWFSWPRGGYKPAEEW